MTMMVIIFMLRLDNVHALTSSFEFAYIIRFELQSQP